jgi:uncharacterized membrane protein (Fun14 family)
MIYWNFIVEPKLAAVIIGLFVAALAYLEYQRILDIDWTMVQVVSQNGITWVADAITHISNVLGTHPAVRINDK